MGTQGVDGAIDSKTRLLHDIITLEAVDFINGLATRSRLPVEQLINTSK